MVCVNIPHWPSSRQTMSGTDGLQLGQAYSNRPMQTGTAAHPGNFKWRHFTL